MNKKISKIDPLQDQRVLQYQLYLAQMSLFSAKSVREAKAIQDRINFLKQKLKNLTKKC